MRLIELIITVALITFIAYLSFNSYSFISSWQARLELDKLYTFCKYAQWRAQLEQIDQVITFDFDKNISSYSLQNRKHVLDKSVQFNILPHVKGPPSSPVELLKKPITFRNNKLRCLPDGLLQAGTVYLTNKNQQVLYALTVPVSAVSYLRTYRYNSALKKWERI